MTTENLTSQKLSSNGQKIDLCNIATGAVAIFISNSLTCTALVVAKKTTTTKKQQQQQQQQTNKKRDSKEWNKK